MHSAMGHHIWQERHSTQATVLDSPLIVMMSVKDVQLQHFKIWWDHYIYYYLWDIIAFPQCVPHTLLSSEDEDAKQHTFPK